MRQFQIVIRTLKQIQDFVELASLQPFEVMVVNERQKINGKDLMGMFCLDYSQPVDVEVICSLEEYSSFLRQTQAISH